MDINKLKIGASFLKEIEARQETLAQLEREEVHGLILKDGSIINHIPKELVVELIIQTYFEDIKEFKNKIDKL